MRRLVAAVMAVAVTASLAGCPSKGQCKDGSQNVTQNGDVFLCVDGRWERQDNPNKPTEVEG